MAAVLVKRSIANTLHLKVVSLKKKGTKTDGVIKDLDITLEKLFRFFLKGLGHTLR